MTRSNDDVRSRMLTGALLVALAGASMGSMSCGIDQHYARLTLTLVGDGKGTVDLSTVWDCDKSNAGYCSEMFATCSEPRCEAECDLDVYECSAEFRLVASPAKGSRLAGWAGDCVVADEPTKAKLWVNTEEGYSCTATFELLGCDELNIVKTTPPHARVGFAYAHHFELSGDGATAVRWEVVGSTPPGLHVTLDGSLEGTPEQAGEYTLDVLVTYACEGVEHTARATFTVSVAAEILECGLEPAEILGAGATCAAIKAADANARSGAYRVGDPAQIVYCDMETDGGGWTALINHGSFDPVCALHPGVTRTSRSWGASSCTGEPQLLRLGDWWILDGYRCGEASIEATLDWVNTIGATEVLLAVVVQGTHHDADANGDTDLTDYPFDQTCAWPTQRDDLRCDKDATFCGLQAVSVNDVAVAPKRVLVGQQFEYPSCHVLGGECAYWMDLPPTMTEVTCTPPPAADAWCSPDCLASAKLEGLFGKPGTRVSFSGDLHLVVGAGRGCWPNCGWGAGLKVMRLMVR